jgi:hypothetical protein
MLVIAPKVFREALSGQVRVDDGRGRIMQFKLSEADLWVRRLTEETQESLRKEVEKSVAEALAGDSSYLFPYVTVKTLAQDGPATETLQTLVSPKQAKSLSELTVAEVVESYDVPTAVRLAAWLQGAKHADAPPDFIDLASLLGGSNPIPGPVTAEPEAATGVGAKPEELPSEITTPEQSRLEASESLVPAPSASPEPGLEPQEAAEPHAGSIEDSRLNPASVTVDGYGLPEVEARPAVRKRGRPRKETVIASSATVKEVQVPPPPPPQEAKEQPPTKLEAKAPTQASLPLPEPVPPYIEPETRRRLRPAAPRAETVESVTHELLLKTPILERSEFEHRLESSGYTVSEQEFQQRLINEESVTEPPSEDWVYVDLRGQLLVCAPASGLGLIRAHYRCLRQIEVTGAANINMATTQVADNPFEAEKLKLVIMPILEKADGFTWLDQPNGWFYIKRYKSRVIKTILKVMSACRKLPLDELMAGVYKSKTGLGPPISRDVFRKLCKHTAGLQVYKDDVVAAKRGWCQQEKLLSEVDQKLVRMFQGKRKVITYQALVQHFADRGLTTATALITPELHPLLKKIAPTLYTLRGITVELNPL